MTEREKAAAGMLYDPNHDPELLAMMHESNCRLFEFNNTPPNDRKRRMQILQEVLGEIGEGSIILGPFHCDYGDNVFIAPNVGIYTAGHPLDVTQRNQGLEYARPVTICDNVWIGGGVQILPGVTVGEGSVIGAGSVVNRDIPAHSLAVGNPCRVIRKIENDSKGGG